MKMFYTVVLMFAFSTISLCASAQTTSASFTEESVNRLLENIIDSLSILNQSKSVTRAIDIDEKFQQVEIFGDVKVFLTNDAQRKLQLKGDESDLDNIKVKVRSGKLTIDASKKTRADIILYISVTDIYSLVAEGSSEIYSSGMINTNFLQITLNGTAMVSVKYIGKLNVIAGHDAELIDIDEYRKIVSRR